MVFLCLWEGGKYHVYSGKECARALGMMSTKVEDCNDNLKDLPEFQREDIEARIKEFEAKYPVYGKVIVNHIPFLFMLFQLLSWLMYFTACLIW